MQRWLVTGAVGMLGTDLVRLLRADNVEVTTATRAQLDVTDAAACAAAAQGHDVVVNCAAYTAVDAAEADEAAAFAVNAVGAANLARAATTAGAALVQVSTDYVFSGTASEPYAADAPLAPGTAYGRTKAAGEWAALAECERTWVVRTAWLYGGNGPSFPATMARFARERDTLTVVTDQVGQPTWTVDLAEGIRRIVAAQAPFGIWHGTSAGSVSKFDQARALFEDFGLDPERIQPTTSAAFPTPAVRPAYSVLSHDMWSAAGIEPLPDWRTAQRRAVAAGYWTA